MRHSVTRLLGLAAAPLLLAACSTLDSLVPSSASLGLSSAPPPAKTTGLAVADEPFAAQTGAAILSQGGSAADAASAMFFALSATYPVAAGLGGGGICLVRDTNGATREYDFLPRTAGAGGAYAVPGAVAGIYDMQKAHGILPWQRVVAPGEAYAATGFPISHVLSLRLAQTQTIVRLDAGLAAEFLDQSGQIKPEGTVVANPELSQTLSAIRLSGADGFYKGAVASGLTTYSAAEGGSISMAEMAAYRASISQARTLNRGGVTAVMPGAATGAGVFIASVTNNATGANPEAAIVASLRRALEEFNITSVPPDLGSTGFAALDVNGQAAACAVTMNGPFGAGRSAGETGVLLAASPNTPAGLASAFLTPMIASDSSGQVVLAGAGSGGPNGSGAIAYAMLRVAAGQPLARPGDLRSTGLAPLATVNAIACQSGLCVALPDPGGHGLGADAGETQNAR